MVNFDITINLIFFESFGGTNLIVKFFYWVVVMFLKIIIKKYGTKNVSFQTNLINYATLNFY